jgi:hypothetical protein
MQGGVRLQIHGPDQGHRSSAPLHCTLWRPPDGQPSRQPRVTRLPLAEGAEPQADHRRETRETLTTSAPTQPDDRAMPDRSSVTAGCLGLRGGPHHRRHSALGHQPSNRAYQRRNEPFSTYGAHIIALAECLASTSAQQHGTRSVYPTDVLRGGDVAGVYAGAAGHGEGRSSKSRCWLGGDRQPHR